jgi:thiol-disulfide isomerase/thioredoxin
LSSPACTKESSCAHCRSESPKLALLAQAVGREFREPIRHFYCAILPLRFRVFQTARIVIESPTVVGFWFWVSTISIARASSSTRDFFGTGGSSREQIPPALHKKFPLIHFPQYVSLSSAYPFSACLTRQPFVFALRKGTPTYFFFPHFLFVARSDDEVAQ